MRRVVEPWAPGPHWITLHGAGLDSLLKFAVLPTGQSRQILHGGRLLILPLTVSRIDQDDLDALAPDWESLHASISPRLPFASPSWNRLWWQHFQRSRSAVADEFLCLAVRDATGRLVGVAPLMVTRRPGGGLPGIHILQPLGADPNLTEVRGIVCRPEHATEVLTALRRHIAGLGLQLDWAQWSGPSTVETAAGVRWEHRIDVHFLPLPATFELFRSQLPRNIKESLRKCYNSLKRDGHEFEFRAILDAAELPAALDVAMQLHARRATADMAIRHGNVFALPQGRAFIHDYMRELAERRRAVVFHLVIGGKIVAARIGFLLEDELYLYYSGYEPEWGRYSIMTTLVAEAIRWATEHGVKIVNLSSGTDVSKTRWRPESVGFAQGSEVCRSVKARGAYALMQWAQRQHRSNGWLARVLQRRRSDPPQGG